MFKKHLFPSSYYNNLLKNVGFSTLKVLVFAYIVEEHIQFCKTWWFYYVWKLSSNKSFFLCKRTKWSSTIVTIETSYICVNFINSSSPIFKIEPRQTQCEFHVVWWSIGIRRILVRWNSSKKIRLRDRYSTTNTKFLESCSSMFSNDGIVPERGIIMVMVDGSFHFKFINLRILNWNLDTLYMKTCTTHTLHFQCKKKFTSIWSEFFLFLMYQLIYKKNACHFQIHMQIRAWLLEFEWWKYHSLT